MNQSVFEYADYKAYLGDRLATSGAGRGLRSKLALHLNCQTAFISQVLKGHTHFSLEHAMQINGFLGHSAEESHYFMLLAHGGRAGTKELRHYYATQRALIHEQRQVVRERIKVKTSLSTADQMKYYSAWYYAAIHVALSIPELQTKNAIAQRLQLPAPLVSSALDFLVSVGLAREAANGRFQIGTTRIHLGQDSPTLSRHHANWRMRAIDSFDRMVADDLHYSSAVTLSAADAQTIKSILLNALERTEAILGPSKEEEIYCLSMDFFRV